MSQSKSIYQKTIVRLYHNSNYGKSIGVKRKNQFIFNGSVEFPDLGEKLFVDLTDINHAKDSCAPSHYDAYMDLIHTIARKNKLDMHDQDRFFFGQLKHVRPVREYIEGFLLYDAISAEGTVCYALDDDNTIFEKFPILPCFGQKNGRSPDYFGSNFDLEPKSTNSNQPSSKTKNILEKLGLE